jgi:hypothetical protein
MSDSSSNGSLLPEYPQHELAPEEQLVAFLQVNLQKITHQTHHATLLASNMPFYGVTSDFKQLCLAYVLEKGFQHQTVSYTFIATWHASDMESLNTIGESRGNCTTGKSPWQV